MPRGKPETQWQSCPAGCLQLATRGVKRVAAIELDLLVLFGPSLRIGDGINNAASGFPNGAPSLVNCRR